MKKKLTLNDFTPVVAWEEIEQKMGKREYKRFLKWLKGQTVSYGGCYIWDLERYLNNKPIID